MTALLAFLRLSWPYFACLGVGLGAGGYLVGNHWEARYSRLQAGHAQELADAQAAARKALQSQLEQFQATSANNEKVIRDLQTQTDQAAADSARDHDLVQRLLNAAQRDASRPKLSQADHQHPAPPAGKTSGDGQLGALLIGVADECRGNARQMNALIEEIGPQL